MCPNSHHLKIVQSVFKVNIKVLRSIVFFLCHLSIVKSLVQFDNLSCESAKKLNHSSFVLFLYLS